MGALKFGGSAFKNSAGFGLVTIMTSLSAMSLAAYLSANLMVGNSRQIANNNQSIGRNAFHGFVLQSLQIERLCDNLVQNAQIRFRSDQIPARIDINEINVASPGGPEHLIARVGSSVDKGVVVSSLALTNFQDLGGMYFANLETVLTGTKLAAPSKRVFPMYLSAQLTPPLQIDLTGCEGTGGGDTPTGEINTFPVEGISLFDPPVRRYRERGENVYEIDIRRDPRIDDNAKEILIGIFHAYDCDPALLPYLEIWLRHPGKAWSMVYYFHEGGSGFRTPADEGYDRMNFWFPFDSNGILEYKYNFGNCHTELRFDAKAEKL